jgi:hypothetical protein
MHDSKEDFLQATCELTLGIAPLIIGEIRGEIGLAAIKAGEEPRTIKVLKLDPRRAACGRVQRKVVLIFTPVV